MRPGIGRGETLGQHRVETEASVVGWIAEDDCDLPSTATRAIESFADEPAAYAGPLPAWRNRHGRQPERPEGCLHARKEDVTDDDATIIGNERDDAVAVRPQPVDEVSLQSLPECRFDHGTDRHVVFRSLLTDNDHYRNPAGDALPKRERFRDW